jgi:hypothetical protein
LALGVAEQAVGHGADIERFCINHHVFEFDTIDGKESVAFGHVVAGAE